MDAETHADVRQVERANPAAATSASLCHYEPSNLCEDINTGVAKGKRRSVVKYAQICTNMHALFVTCTIALTQNLT